MTALSKICCKVLSKTLSKIVGIVAPEGAVWFYPFYNNSNLDQVSQYILATDLRDSVKNVEQSDGTIEQFAANTFGYKRGVGALLEGEADNLITYSQDFSNAAWSKVGSATVTNGYSSPDGGTNAYLLDNIQDATGARLLEVVESGISVDGRTFTGSIWLKANGNAGEIIQVGIKRQAGGSATADTIDYTLTNEWERVGVTFTGATSNTGVIFQIANAGTADADSCLIYQCDVVEFNVETIPVITTGATATREADAATVPTSDAFVDDAVYLGDFTG